MLDLLTAAPREVKFGERKLLVGALKLREFGLLNRWIRDHAERPTVRAKRECETLDPADHRETLKAATEEERLNWPPTVETREGGSLLLGDPDGQMHFLTIMLRKYQPEMTDDDLDGIAAGLSQEDLGVLAQIAFGQDDLDPEAVRAAAQERLQKVRDKIRDQIAAALEQTMDSSSTPSSPLPPE